MTRACVGFDIDHTLAIDNKLERIAFLRLLERLIDEGGSSLGSLIDETAYIDDLLLRQRRGECTIDQAVLGFVNARGVAPEQTHARLFRAMALEMVDDLVVPLPYAAATLETLRERGVPTAVLSNGWNPLQTRKARRAGFPGPVLASGDLGVQKPEPRAFDALREHFDAAARDVWYVGDDPRTDVGGAAAAGMQAVWLDAEGLVFPEAVPAPAHVIHALPELLALLPETVHS